MIAAVDAEGVDPARSLPDFVHDGARGARRRYPARPGRATPQREADRPDEDRDKGADE